MAKVLEKLKNYEHLGARFQPTEQMRTLAAAGKGFYARVRKKENRSASGGR
ncbi:MAG: hypothetical protein ACRELG_25400 [Gemmataceae bacterium]